MADQDRDRNEYHSSYHFESESDKGNGGGERKNGSYHYRYESTRTTGFAAGKTPRKKNGGVGCIPWWVIVLCFVLGLWPVGIILVVLRAGQESKGREYARNAADKVRSAAENVKRTVQAEYRNNESDAGQTNADHGNQTRKGAAARPGGNNGTMTKNIIATRLRRIKNSNWMTILGAILAICCGMATANAVSNNIGYLSYEPLWLLEDALAPFIMTGIGAGLFTWGQLKKRKSRKFKRYINLIGDQEQVSIDALASALPADPDKVADTLQDMIDQGIFGEQAYINYSYGMLVLDGSGVKATEKPKQKPAAEAAGEDATLLRRIREANDRIANEEMSRKIDRIEEITERILEFQKEHPDKAADLRKFLNYYLPTTLKILNTYAEMEKQGITGENINATKQRVENMMDMVVEGFERQLDKLFAGDMMDIAADITVMQQMMEGDGLFERDDMQMGGH